MFPIIESQRLEDGRFVSWAQNAEDVYLLRLFGEKERGTYVDVGANHPSFDSVTKNFYLAGWRGINIEPVQPLYELLQNERPEDINLLCVASSERGVVEFRVDLTNFDLSGVAASMPDETLTMEHPYEIQAVTSLPLREIIRENLGNNPVIDFLKVDVEGHEYSVLQGIAFDEVTIRTIVAEVRNTDCDQVRDLLAAEGYVQTLWDGLNSWFVHQSESQLLEDQHWRPCFPVLDGYHPWIYWLQLRDLRVAYDSLTQTQRSDSTLS
jgi:FkbM family methyltransferase